MIPSRDIQRLVEIMRALRHPETGCPWDLEQSFDSIVPYTIEETYEVVDAIQRRDAEDLCEELGDLLLQVVYYSQLAQEAGLFEFGDVVSGITSKMIRRHPHVFGDAEQRDAGAVKGNWNRIKADEKAQRAQKRLDRAAKQSEDGDWHLRPEPEKAGLLDTVSGAFPAVILATKLQEKAATVGFDWPDPEPIIDKVREETNEFAHALETNNRRAQEDELGDLLFSVVNLARAFKIDPEVALRRTVQKFRDRFSYIEQELARTGSSIEKASLEEMEVLWQRAKQP
ncbi:nucleoside triphosphate pyrophosphohydrolase [Aureimonas fodinaquatilis]|uniref:Nucleoside triphosphate pyrophosphohydrolase n=1 Tax=Aureimonas fodinaquatilis TaxID=2565783 RepID=A0A5B0DZE5_9HYPH|nr:nucleoside triphosphate pyrophosphohydrolase [Aureimonas fodinaquatilis]KAA0971215.1 nucleoside triphosphate pyrophosphohydrolase [Aureimonas fodinaquatilis]